jgi:serine/threonine-protein kinase
VFEPGTIIDKKYKIVRPIGVGGMGEVYEGENLRISRRVAIKVLHASAAQNKDAVARFEREAQAAGRIGSDHILEILDLGTLESGEHFIVMEYLDGETLGARISRVGRLTPEQIYPLLRQSLVGLGAAHGAGIIHRDLKPDNLFILREKAGTQDFVKIIDFGISKFHSLGGDMSMTRTGSVMGTPYYMSPEQARGSRDIDVRSDVYAMGVIMYEALSGAKPFTAETFNELLFKIVLSTPPPLSEIVGPIDHAFETIVYKAMARDVEHRFVNAEALIQALDGWAQGGKPVTVPPAIGHGMPPEVEIPRAAPLPAAGVPAMPPAATTQGAVWSSSSDDFSPPMRSSKAPLVVAFGMVGVVLLGGGAFAAYKLSPRESAAADPSASSAAELASAAVDPSAIAESEVPAPSAEPAESAAPEAAEPAPSAEQPSAEAPEASKPVASKPVASKPVASKPVASKPVASKPVTPPPVEKPTTTKPVVKPTTKPKPGNEDFGY